MPAQNQALASNASEFLQLEVQLKFHTKSECLHSAEIYSLTGCKAVSALQTHDLKYLLTTRQTKRMPDFPL
jgi:hypothetical protein